MGASPSEHARTAASLRRTNDGLDIKISIHAGSSTGVCILCALRGRLIHAQAHLSLSVLVDAGFPCGSMQVVAEPVAAVLALDLSRMADLYP